MAIQRRIGKRRRDRIRVRDEMRKRHVSTPVDGWDNMDVDDKLDKLLRRIELLEKYLLGDE